MSGNCLSKLDSLIDGYKHIIELLTLIGVIIALYFQNKTIRKQKEEFDRQRIKDDKSDFYNLYQLYLNEYNQFVDKCNGMNTKGRVFYKQSFFDYLGVFYRAFCKEDFVCLLKQYNSEDYLDFQISLEQARCVLHGKTDLEEDIPIPYFHIINSLLAHLENFEIKDSYDLKKITFDHFFSKLNAYEIQYILLFCACDEGKNIRDIINKYSLLEKRKVFPFFKNIVNEQKIVCLYEI
ncbi:putative phage abortive infection protein [Myroides odoratus]|uniref:putative phage abortive infection protein n=1 Tax=Myroides odoratus TaxID=256 RepID=UPI00333EFB9E